VKEEKMLGTILGIGIPVVSVAVAVITWRIIYKVLDERTFSDAPFWASIGAVVWPLSLSLMCGFWAYEAWSVDGRTERLQRKRRKELVAEQHKTNLAQELARRERLVTAERVQQLELQNRERALLGLPTVTL
jgi:hypothetical protein